MSVVILAADGSLTRPCRVLALPPTAPFVIRSGSVLIHVRDASQVAEAFSALQPQLPPRAADSDTFPEPLAATSDIIMDATTTAAPASKSARCATSSTYVLRNRIDGNWQRWMKQVNSGYSLARHVSLEQLRRQALDFAHTITGDLRMDAPTLLESGTSSPAHDGEPAGDPQALGKEGHSSDMPSHPEAVYPPIAAAPTGGIATVADGPPQAFDLDAPRDDRRLRERRWRFDE